jgi:hypothetical protein
VTLAASCAVIDSAVNQHLQICGQHQRLKTILNEQLPRHQRAKGQSSCRDVGGDMTSPVTLVAPQPTEVSCGTI